MQVQSEVDYYGVLPYNNDSFDNIRLTGDFNGDSYLDFVMNNGTIKLGAFNDAYQDVSTGKVFNTDAKVVSTLLDEEGQVYNGNGIVQYENNTITGYIFRNNAFVKVFEKLVQPVCVTCTNTATINEGDVNGDGISDIFLTLISGAFVDRYIIDLKNSNAPISTYSGGFAFDENSYTNQKYMDIDGDGKIDILNISNTDYTVFEFIKTAPNQYLKKIKYTSSLAETKDPEFPVLFGDFNGDGNLDFTIPVTDNQNEDNWRFYIGKENGFQNTLKTNFLKYRKPTQPANLSLIDHHFYSISDINKDGKSDIVFIYSKNSVGAVGTSGNALWRTLQYEVKTKLSNGGTDFIAGLNTTSPSYNVGGAEYGLFQPLTSPIKSNNNYYDIFVFKNTRVHKYKAQTSLAELSRIQSITQGGITTFAKYLEVIPANITLPDFYKKVKKEYYPYFSLTRVDQSYAVSQLQQADRKQDFRYRGMTGHLQGKGIMGFHQTARSSWYADGFENTKIWSGAEIDPLNDGLPVKEWSIRTNDENNIFPADISENNTQLLSFKSTIYQTDKLLNGQVVTIINDTDKPKIVTAIIPKSTLVKNFLTNTVTSGTITYGDYYLPAQSVSSINSNYAVTTSTFEYIHNPSGTGSDYYIGRPKTKTDVVQAYGDTKSAKEEYTYENNLLKTQKTWNRDNTGYLQETYNYDGFGNVIQKVISNSIDSQTQTNQAQYDAKGRFVVKKTDNLGLETNIEYNDWGQIKKETDPLGNILINTYDNWGKLLTSKTNLGGTTTYQYEKDNNANVIVTQNDPDGDISKKYTNKLGQDYKVSTKAFGQGQYISKETQYDVLGRKTAESEPYFDGQSASSWNIIAYDDSVFPSKVTATSFNGKQMETTVSGLTTTVKELNGYGRITSKTNDALGNVVSSTDKGGTIQFTYNAAGEQIKAQYAENIVTTKYDVWGRKSEFNDPSNGTYKYEYDGFGQPKKIISPKGTKEYTYNTLGQLIIQRELSTTDGGQATDKTISYSYDNKGRVTSRSGTSKGKAYSSNVVYDPQGRVLSSSESSNGKYFIQKGITYDDKARVISYEKQLYSSGTLTKVQIENIYSSWNGELSQIKDKNSGKVLWSLVETNAKGQVLKANLGKSRIYNAYDNNGFLTSIDHQHWMQLQGTPSILQINYTFDAIRNELKSRNTLGDFNILEEFDYDDNNRLVNWTDPVTGIKPSSSRNVYDIKGRILENDQVGTIKFENSAKVYQPTGMTLNAAGTQNYNNDLIQSIAYNENNDPVFIDGEKGDVAFQYGLSSMRQRVTYGGNFSIDDDGKFTKFYSEDGSFEILKDNVTGKEKHILYIEGTPYESNIIYLKNYDDATSSYKFLHKDYLGSILAISDEDGNKLEQRHFDAWGNFTHLQIGNGPIITDKNIINTTSLVDRGYTSHEHFAEVGIIHMNGRLYDPLLRRFLNADENIQDPTNTQNYNKYGYVLNNPLMFSDPNGEFFFLAPIIAWVATNAIAIGTGALIGAALGAIMYVGQAIYANNWSWGGFAKAIVTGAVTGAVSAGAGQIFSAGGFWATVGNGALAGAGSGGITSLINGTNFLQGLAKGAVIGGVVGAVSWGVSKAVKAVKVTQTAKANHEYTTIESDVYNNSNNYSSDKVDYNIETVKEFDEAYGGLGNHGVKTVYNRTPEGYGLAENNLFYKKTWFENLFGGTRAEGNVLGLTTPSNNIYLSPGAYASKSQFVDVITHETGHVVLNTSKLSQLANVATKNMGVYSKNLDNLGHVSIRKMSVELFNKNSWLKLPWHIPERYFYNSDSRLDGLLQKLIKGFKF
ncbi:FG-GAP-like repeat-containing protein [Chryseobacterium daecheongense]|uniref:RHS repeat-associated core domain-containing protein n=1 Tax=Chryseobacterium daecheongense TaxID=192389 RepID=UPI001FD6343C|nr:RHS repeat-associated core domain-containing protein [Chryseobacterium daecheongense]UOU96861.1 FG-GAP-like repeat-containing protein [Chryseobacterium daecheongense]